MKFLRMMPGYGETTVAEGDPRVADERERLVEAFRDQLDLGMWAAVPLTEPDTGRREAVLVTRFEDVPPDADRVLFWPRAMGGSPER